MKYQEPPDQDPPAFSRAAVDEALQKDDTEVLRSAVVSVSLYSDDQEFAEHLCQTLAIHDDPIIRGNAILGLGHLARKHGSLDLIGAVPLLTMALGDANAYISGHAKSAVDDIQHFLSVDLGL
jgi:hypothetical protein